MLSREDVPGRDCVVWNTFEGNDLGRHYRACLLFVRFTQAVGLGFLIVRRWRSREENVSVLTIDSWGTLGWEPQKVRRPSERSGMDVPGRDCVVWNTFEANDLGRPYRACLLFVRFTQAAGLGWYQAAPLVLGSTGPIARFVPEPTTRFVRGPKARFVRAPMARPDTSLWHRRRNSAPARMEG